MSTVIPSVNLAGLAAGASASVPLPVSGCSLLRLQNESGCGLACTMEGSGRGFNLAAGQWLDVPLLPSELRLDYTVTYVLANAPVALLLMTGYEPAEDIPPMGVLGNSPIGLSGSVSAVTNQVINDGNPAPTEVVEGTPSGGSQSLLLINDGSGALSGGKVTFDSAGEMAIPILRLPSQASPPSGSALSGQIDDNSASHSMQYWTQQAGAAQGHEFVTWDGAAVQVPLGVGSIAFNAATQINQAGAFSQVGGQASAGSFGVPVIVAQAVRVHVTGTGATTILSFTPTVAMVLRASAYVSKGDTTVNKPSLSLNWKDPDNFTGVLNTVFFSSANFGVTTPVNWDGSANSFPASPYAIIPLVAVVQANQAVTIVYNDPSGAVADYVTAILERIA